MKVKNFTIWFNGYCVASGVVSFILILLRHLADTDIDFLSHFRAYLPLSYFVIGLVLSILGFLVSLTFGGGK